MVYELIDLIEDRNSPSAYFQKDFESRLCAEAQMRQTWLAREAEFQKLSNEAWCLLKEKARPYLAVRDQRRDWEGLISVLNEARAYGYLRSFGCSDVRFIPEGETETRSPDLEADLIGRRVLCEVKTVQKSDLEVRVRSGECVGSTKDELSPGFFNKFAYDLKQAKSQMEAYRLGKNEGHVVYVVINFDDLLGRYKEQYYKQIDNYLSRNPVPGIEIVFHNQKTAFHTQIAMNWATVFNE